MVPARAVALLVATVAVALPAAAPGQDKAAPAVRKHADIAYRSDPAADPDRHKLDLYVPSGEKNFPVLFFVHGGTWRSGNKGMYVALGEAFAKLGIGTVVINYRLSPAVKHPAHVEDVAKAFAWTRENVGKYGGDKEKITLFGHSAGGHLVSLLATDPAYLKAENLTPAAVRGVVSVSGVYSIAPELPLFHPIFGTDEKVCRLASPLSHVTGKQPPFLLAYGDKDFDHLDRMALDMAAALKKYDSPHTVMKCEGRNHYSIIMLSIQPDDTLHKAIRDFATR
ncbi:MAG TPA: alpha/beta hydrolase [Urbifossiella sp.]|jgi:poly(3-hydroxybutyrate) depolymerase|nr:alpha/beta hydrolase [Urbifossiella sp.]